MKREALSYQRMFKVFWATLAASAAALVLVPLGMPGGPAAYAIDAVFWGGLAVSQAVFWRMNALRKRLEHGLMKRKRKGRIGLCAFFRNTPAVLADIAFLVALALLALSVAVPIQNVWCVSLIAAALYAGIYLHCVFNGRNYRFLKSLKRMELSRRDGGEI